MASHIKKGDTVQVISGNHRGKQGKVLLVGAERVIVEGVRIVKKHNRRSQALPQGGITEKEGPIHISNVKVVAAAAE
ncbi:MAG: 50S ribosomal protein L24 [Verrucomicrobia bacterium]|nr:50S ribosomal protein L24 [Verrucomicrobiota bacterium]